MEAINFRGITISSNEITAFLKQKMIYREICSQIVYGKIIDRVATERNIIVTAREIERKAEEVRRAKQIETTSETIEWLKNELLDTDEWEEALAKELLAQKLARELFAQEAESYFVRHRLDFDEFILYQLVVPYLRLARELFYQIEEEEISFYRAVHLYDIDEQRRYVCGYEGKVHRRDYPADLAAEIFKSPISVGQLIGPIHSEQGCHLFKIESYTPAQLSSEVHQEIIYRLFQQWLVGEFSYLINSADRGL